MQSAWVTPWVDMFLFSTTILTLLPSALPLNLHIITILNIFSVVQDTETLHLKESLLPNNSHWKEQGHKVVMLVSTGNPHVKNRSLESSEPQTFQLTHHRRHPRRWHVAWCNATKAKFLWNSCCIQKPVKILHFCSSTYLFILKVF